MRTGAARVSTRRPTKRLAMRPARRLCNGSWSARVEAPNEQVVSVERPFSVRIGDDRVRGRYDAVRETAEGTIITDYKTGDMRDPVRARQRARGSLQLQLYSLAYEAETGAPPAGRGAPLP